MEKNITDNCLRNENPSLPKKNYAELGYKLLLPHDPGIYIRDTKMRDGVLSVFTFIVGSLVRALESFYIERNYSKFDPHVGETACQVRSYIVLLFAKECEIVSSVSVNERIEYLNNIHEGLRNELINKHKMNKRNNSLTIEEYLNLVGGRFIISEFEFFLVASYLLTYYKKEHKKWDGFSDYKNMAIDAGISIKLAHKLTKFYQKRLSGISCDYILSWYNDLGDSLNDGRSLSNYIFCDNSRYVFSAYLSTKIILEHMRASVSVILIVYHQGEGRHTSSMFFFERLNQRGVELVTGDLSRVNDPCFVVVSETSQLISSVDAKKYFLDNIFALGVDKCILANTASHPQYSGRMMPHSLGLNETKELGELQPSALINEIKNMTSWAVEKGCCRSNKETFQIRHIYCDTLHRLLDRKKHEL